MAGIEGLDHDHGSAATGTRDGERICPVIGCRDGFGFVLGRRYLEQFTGQGQVLGAPAVGEEAVMADAVSAELASTCVCQGSYMSEKYIVNKGI